MRSLAANLGTVNRHICPILDKHLSPTTTSAPLTAMPLEQGSRLDDAVNRITKLWHSRGMKGPETKRESTEEKILNVTLQKMNIEILIETIRRRTEDGSHPILDALNHERS